MKLFKAIILFFTMSVIFSCAKDEITDPIIQSSCSLSDTTAIKTYFAGQWQMDYTLEAGYPFCVPLNTVEGVFNFNEATAVQLGTVCMVAFGIKDGSRTLIVSVMKKTNDAAATFAVNFGGNYGLINNFVTPFEDCGEGFTVQGDCGLLTIKRVR